MVSLRDQRQRVCGPRPAGVAAVISGNGPLRRPCSSRTRRKPPSRAPSAPASPPATPRPSICYPEAGSSRSASRPPISHRVFHRASAQFHRHRRFDGWVSAYTALRERCRPGRACIRRGHSVGGSDRQRRLSNLPGVRCAASGKRSGRRTIRWLPAVRGWYRSHRSMRRPGAASSRLTGARQGTAPLPAPWKRLRFRSPDVRTAFLKLAVARRRLLPSRRTSRSASTPTRCWPRRRSGWAGFKTFIGAVHDALKARYPSLTVFRVDPRIRGFPAPCIPIRRRWRWRCATPYPARPRSRSERPAAAQRFWSASAPGRAASSATATSALTARSTATTSISRFGRSRADLAKPIAIEQSGLLSFVLIR